ncbi:MAG TPA: PilN domain-containing protein [Tepidisphaeraceae bacterium]|jgi:Tfp pilus assembly protein PilN|nr:PilN domain-containing protein [Tepidisphaeraceae bacterium]
MRELEFLPEWYPRLRKRKRMVGVQTWATGVLIIGLCLWGWLSGRNIRSASASLHLLQGEISQADNELQRLDEALGQKKELDAKNLIIRKLGNHVESTRVLVAIESAMPEEMALLDFSAEVKETARPMSGLAAASAAQNNQPVADRRLEISVQGVGPTDATLARFMRNLGESGLFDRINLTLTQERVDNNRIMRQFGVTFGVDLNNSGSIRNSSGGVH